MSLQFPFTILANIFALFVIKIFLHYFVINFHLCNVIKTSLHASLFYVYVLLNGQLLIPKH